MNAYGRVGAGRGASTSGPKKRNISLCFAAGKKDSKSKNKEYAPGFDADQHFSLAADGLRLLEGLDALESSEVVEDDGAHLLGRLRVLFGGVLGSLSRRLGAVLSVLRRGLLGGGGGGRGGWRWGVCGFRHDRCRFGEGSAIREKGATAKRDDNSATTVGAE